MKHVELAVAFVAVLLSATVALGQAPPPTPPPTYDPYRYSYAPAPQPRCAWYEFWCSESVYRNPKLSPTTKRKLYEHDPNVCHCDECRRARLAAGVESQGYQPYRVPPPRRFMRVLPRPPMYTPVQPYKVYPLRWCKSLMNYIPSNECPDKK